MTSPTFSMKLFASLGAVVLVVAITFGLAFSLNSGVHAAGGKFHAQPRFFHFANRAADTVGASAKTQLKHWTSSFRSGGTKYSYTMVGTNPAHSAATTTVPVTIVPIKLTFSDNSTFDGTQKVASTTASPIFQRTQFSSGKTQYADAIQRAEFWKYVSPHRGYHVLLGAPTVTPTVNVTVPAADGSTQNFGSITAGLVDVNWFDSQVIQPLLSSQHFTSNMLPIFLTYNVFLYEGDSSTCCIIGYHNAVTTAAGLQTYIWASYNDPGIFSNQPIEDVNALSHEVSEWYNDPFVNNAVPPWSVPAAPQYGCTSLLEVGDPLVGTVFIVNGYHLQDEAFFSWFARQHHSIAMHGRYTYLGTFTTYSPSC